MFELPRGDVETAIKSNLTYLTVHRLAAENADIFDKYNRFAEFWMLNAYRVGSYALSIYSTSHPGSAPEIRDAFRFRSRNADFENNDGLAIVSSTTFCTE
jgi:hypothetical protein